MWKIKQDPQMRRSGWKLDPENHALERRGAKYSFLTLDDFQSIGQTNGIRKFTPIPTCARATLVIPHYEVAYVPMEMKGKADEQLAFFEPDCTYIGNYQAYPCPGIMELANPTVVRLLNASADQPLRVMVGTVLGNAKPVSRVADGFYLEVNWGEDIGIQGQANESDNVDFIQEYARGRVLPVTGVCGGPMTYATPQSMLPMPSIVVAQPNLCSRMICRKLISVTL